MDVLQKFKETQKAGWAHFAPMQMFTTIPAARLVEHAGVRGGMRVLAVGCGTCVGAARLMKSLLFSVSPWDPLTFAAVPALIGLVALIACYVPAPRASRVDAARASEVRVGAHNLRTCFESRHTRG
jgi:hypothetical protein